MSANHYKADKGMHLYARLCASLVREPMTTSKVAAANDCYARHLGITMRGLRDRGVIHVQSWVREDVWCWWAEVWAFGPGKDAPRPLTNKGTLNTRIAKSQFRIETFMFGLVIKALEEGADVPMVSELTGLHRTTAQALIGHMRRLKLIHICDWIVPQTGGLVAVYKLGDKRQAIRPRRRTHSERHTAASAKVGARVPAPALNKFLAAPLAQ